MKLVPYIHFEGNCEEALQFYQQLFNGELMPVNRFETAPFPTPDHWKQKILHGHLNLDGNTLYASDTMPGQTTDWGDHVSLCISYTNEDRMHHVFNALAEGGQITMPLAKMFWGSWFGQVTDRYGVKWMLTTEMESR